MKSGCTWTKFKNSFCFGR